LVALNSDSSVRTLKGPTRPITPEHDRAEVLASLRCVDFITIFPSLRVTDVINVIRPHIYVKGGDYTVESLDNRGARRLGGSWHGDSHPPPLTPGKSTTGIVKRFNP
jgi:rfaE bifunctional protein nucleotidyltransferase chain/domain